MYKRQILYRLESIKSNKKIFDTQGKVSYLLSFAVAIRVEGDWERYGSIDFNASGHDLDGDAFATLNGSVKPTILSAKISAIYMFNAA